MSAVAFMALVCFAFGLLPGSSFKRKPKAEDYNWAGPHVYANLAYTAAALTLAVWVLL